MASSAVLAECAGGLASWEAMLEALMSADNSARGAAEAVYNECRVAQPEATARRLLHTARHGAREELRNLATVLLRRALIRPEESLWGALPAAAQGAVKAELLQAVVEERSAPIANKLYDTVADLALLGPLEDGTWPELLPFLFQCVQQQQEPRLQAAALLIFSQLAVEVAPLLSPYMGTLHPVLAAALQSESAAVRGAGLRATASFVQGLEDKAQREQLRGLLPSMLSVFITSLQAGEEHAAQEVLESLVDIAGAAPHFFRRQLAETLDAMVSVAETVRFEDGTRQMALEFVVTLAEGRDKAPGMVRRLPAMVGRAVAVAMHMLTEDVEDDPAWHAAEEDDDGAIDSELYAFGQEVLDRIAIALGGSSILPVAAQLLPQYLASPEWQRRHAALVTLAQVAEGCAKLMTRQLGPVVEWVLGSFGDTSPRVRWAAINAIGQMCTDLGPEIQMREHARIVPALLRAMDDTSSARVQAHAAAAVVNFTENCEPDVVEMYLDGLVERLLQLLRGGGRLVQEGALTALASVADASQARFVKYYDAVMPFLKSILVNATDRSHRMLRAKSMECISLVGMAVGRDKFRDDAVAVMEVLTRLQHGGEMDADDPTSSYMLQAWTRLCKCLGQEFLPYMSVVMPPLLRSAQLKPDVIISDGKDGGAGGDGGDDDDDDDDTVETIVVGDKRIGIRTSVLEEKATACNMLCCYADELKEGFFPYVEQVAPIMVPLLRFYLHEEVRKAAVSCIPELLRSAALAVEKGVAQGRDRSFVKQLSDFVLPALVQALAKEPDVEVMSNILEALAEVVGIAGNLVDAAQLAALTVQLKAVVDESARRRQDLAARRQECAEDFDEEEEEALQEDVELENGVLEQATVVLGAMLKAFGGAALPYVDEMLPLIAPLVAEGRSAGERRIGLCVLDDVLEDGGPAAVQKYLTSFMGPLLSGSRHPDADVRQAAAYGLGVAAERAGAALAPYTADVVQVLTAIITAPGAREEPAVMATENAIAALGKVVEMQASALPDRAGAVQLWLQSLPLKEDRVEAKVAHRQLVAMLERRDADLLGADQRHAAAVGGVLAQLAQAPDLVDEDTAHKVAAIVAANLPAA